MPSFSPVSARPVSSLPQPAVIVTPQLLLDSEALVTTIGDSDAVSPPQLLLDSAATVSTLGDTDAPTVLQLTLDSVGLVATVGDADLTDIPNYVPRDVPAGRTFAPSRQRLFFPVG